VVKRLRCSRLFGAYIAFEEASIEVTVDDIIRQNLGFGLKIRMETKYIIWCVPPALRWRVVAGFGGDSVCFCKEYA
jgi:hypothetical protein